jgi:hypothetical protein
VWLDIPCHVWYRFYHLFDFTVCKSLPQNSIKREDFRQHLWETPWVMECLIQVTARMTKWSLINFSSVILLESKIIGQFKVNLNFKGKETCIDIKHFHYVYSQASKSNILYIYIYIYLEHGCGKSVVDNMLVQLHQIVFPRKSAQNCSWNQWWWCPCY